jgi:hypothetical protein
MPKMDLLKSLSEVGILPLPFNELLLARQILKLTAVSIFLLPIWRQKYHGSKIV